MIQVNQYEEVDNGLVPLSFTDGEFKDIKFTIGKVSLKENEEQTELILQYDLDFIDDTNLPYDAYERFKVEVGKYIVHQIEKGDIIYSGGIGGTYIED